MSGSAGLGGVGTRGELVGDRGLLLDVTRDVDAVAEEWDHLADQLRAGPFARPGWIRAWWRAFGKGTLNVLTVRRGQLTGILPLVHRRWGVTSPTNAHTPEFGILTDDAPTLHALAQAIFQTRPSSVALGYLESEGTTDEACRHAALASGYRVIAGIVRQRSPYLTIAGDWNAYERSLEHKVVAELRRRRRALERQAGSVSLNVSDGVSRLGELLEEGFRLESSGWKEARRTAIVSRPETHRFYVDVAEWAARRGSLRLAFLRTGQRAVAFQLGLEEQGAYYFLKGGYDPAYQRFAPGRLLLHDLIARAFATGLERFEFLGDAEPWKLRWTSTLRTRVGLHAFAPSLPGLARWAATRTYLLWLRPFRKWMLRHF